MYLCQKWMELSTHFFQTGLCSTSSWLHLMPGAHLERRERDELVSQSQPWICNFAKTWWNWALFFFKEFYIQLSCYRLRKISHLSSLSLLFKFECNGFFLSYELPHRSLTQSIQTCIQQAVDCTECPELNLNDVITTNKFGMELSTLFFSNRSTFNQQLIAPNARSSIWTSWTRRTSFARQTMNL